MTIKEFLNQAYIINERIKSNKLQIERLRVIAGYVAIPDLVKIHAQTYRKAERLENTVAAIVDLESEIQEEIREFIKAVKDVRKVINRISDHKLKLILQKRYLDFEKWSEIAIIFNCSVRQVLRLHGLALIKAENNVTKFHLDKRDILKL